jgi:hypothetical protein
MSLPIPAKIHTRLGRQRQRHRVARLIPVADPAVILAPDALLGIADQIRAADVVEMAVRAAPQSGVEGLCGVRGNPVQAVGQPMVDPSRHVRDVVLSGVLGGVGNGGDDAI